VVGFKDETLDGIMVAPTAAWLPNPQLPVSGPSQRGAAGSP